MRQITATRAALLGVFLAAAALVSVVYPRADIDVYAWDVVVSYPGQRFSYGDYYFVIAGRQEVSVHHVRLGRPSTVLFEMSPWQAGFFIFVAVAITFVIRRFRARRRASRGFAVISPAVRPIATRRDD